MKLIIEVTFEDDNGLQMENRLNKAIDDLSAALEKKGLTEMNLMGQETTESFDIETMYNVKITKE